MPRLDLVSFVGLVLYVQPFLYEPDSLHFLIGHNEANEDDLPRNANGRAFLEDGRNDENLIVSELTLGCLKYHNRVVNAIAHVPQDMQFDEARRIVRWHFQWAVIHDFLVRL